MLHKKDLSIITTRLLPDYYEHLQKSHSDEVWKVCAWSKAK